MTSAELQAHVEVAKRAKVSFLNLPAVKHPLADAVLALAKEVERLQGWLQRANDPKRTGSIAWKLSNRTGERNELQATVDRLTAELAARDRRIEELTTSNVVMKQVLDQQDADAASDWKGD